MRYLFSFNGRLSRSYMWMYLLISIAMMVAIKFCQLVANGHYSPSGQKSMTEIAAMTVALVLAIGWLVSTLAVCTTRLHDRNKSAIWLVPFVIIPAVLEVMDDRLQIFDSSQYLPLGDGVNAPLAIAAALLIWGFVELCCLRGTRGSNDYGPDPQE